MQRSKFVFIILIITFILFVSCNYIGNSGSSKNISFLNNYRFTSEVKMMDSSQVITGIDEYNNQNPGAFKTGREVTLSPFYIAKYEVTQELYAAVMSSKTELGKTLSSTPSICTLEDDEFNKMISADQQKYRPVENVTWYDAVYFCNELSSKMNLDKVYTITVTEVDDDGHIIDATVSFDKLKNGYRLPTEAEWEYAARGGSYSNSEEFSYYFAGATTSVNIAEWVNTDLDSVAWYIYNLSNGTSGSDEVESGAVGYGTHQVGRKHSNKAGLFDMSGNVREWCYDWYEDISEDAVENPSGPDVDTADKIIRGGSWEAVVQECVVNSREYENPDVHYNNLGFRFCRNAQ